MLHTADPVLSAAQEDAAAKILQAPVLSAERISHGANNLVCSIRTGTGSFVLKHYLETPGDRRDRFRAETEGLRFMNAQRIPCVPELVGDDIENRLAVMNFRAGDAIETVSDSDIDAAVSFATALHEAGIEETAQELGEAAEACLAPTEVSRQIVERRQRLDPAAADHPALAEFLGRDFDPTYTALADTATTQLAQSGIDLNAPLPRDRQTLSPSDFGFHNALRDGGHITFVDFEYFGWDDPVRLVSDFLLHPGHRLSTSQKDHFASAMSRYFATHDDCFISRLEALYPLIGLRWCMILLNEFLPERLARRRAVGTPGDTADILARQLEKSAALLLSLHKTKRVSAF